MKPQSGWMERWQTEEVEKCRDLRGATLRQADLREADLSAADLRGANLIGADLHRADLRGADLGEADVRMANLGEARMKGADLTEANLESADLEGADLTEARLPGAQLSNAKLSSARLAKADLHKAELRLTTLTNADLQSANLRDACCNGAVLRGAVLREADLRLANLVEADLRKADLRSADLRDAQLRGAALPSACLALADLRGAGLEEAILYDKDGWGDADFSGVKYDNHTSFRRTDISRSSWSTNPLLKRHIEDQQWLSAWRHKNRWNQYVLYPLWWVLCDCGRSLLRWALWCALIAFLFGCLYSRWGECFLVSTAPGATLKDAHWVTPFYYSIVVFTTLGFGDVAPKPDQGFMQVCVVGEVILGYIMLGGLLSIFSNKLARQS